MLLISLQYDVNNKERQGIQRRKGQAEDTLTTLISAAITAEEKAKLSKETGFKEKQHNSTADRNSTALTLSCKYRILVSG